MRRRRDVLRHGVLLLRTAPLRACRPVPRRAMTYPHGSPHWTHVVGSGETSTGLVTTGQTGAENVPVNVSPFGKARSRWPEIVAESIAVRRHSRSRRNRPSRCMWRRAPCRTPSPTSRPCCSPCSELRRTLREPSTSPWRTARWQESEVGPGQTVTSRLLQVGASKVDIVGNHDRGKVGALAGDFVDRASRRERVPAGGAHDDGRAFAIKLGGRAGVARGRRARVSAAGQGRAAAPGDPQPIRGGHQNETLHCLPPKSGKVHPTASTIADKAAVLPPPATRSMARTDGCRPHLYRDGNRGGPRRGS